MKKRSLYGYLILSFGFVLNCGPVQELKYTGPDLVPPQFIGVKCLAAEEVELTFNEAAEIKMDELLIEPLLDVVEIRCAEDDLKVHIYTAKQVVGQLYNMKVRAEDLHKNSLSFSVSFYGYNPSIPKIVINEFITNGSSTHPDLVELKVLESGNLGGLVIYEGTPGSFDDAFIFPACEVNANDFILVHFKPQALSVEYNETTDKQLSEGLDASQEAYDFWVQDGDGLSSNNGVLSLWTSPGGSLLDSVLYSNRTSYADEEYGGFGTKEVCLQARELVSHHGWKISAEQVRPEDGINPEGSTSTRSLCRRPPGMDTDTKTDWYIVSTRQASFGKENSPEIYIQPAKSKSKSN